MSSQEIACLICGSHNIYSRPYLRGAVVRSPVRELIYAIPSNIISGPGAALLNSRLKNKLNPILVNKKFFSGLACFCLSCQTGWHDPFFDAKTLANYYEEFYWGARSAREAEISPRTSNAMPSASSLARTLDRIAWLRTHVSSIGSVLDLGAGDCAASWVFKYIGNIQNVFVSDPSLSVRQTAAAYSLDHLAVESASGIDLIFSSHSIEHVNDFIAAMSHLSSCLSDNGYIFIETPNIASLEIFNSLVHTPHTFMGTSNNRDSLAIERH